MTGRREVHKKAKTNGAGAQQCKNMGVCAFRSAVARLRARQEPPRCGELIWRSQFSLMEAVEKTAVGNPRQNVGCVAPAAPAVNDDKSLTPLSERIEDLTQPFLVETRRWKRFC